MISPEILKKIEAIKIRTRRFMNGTIAGSHVTKQKGSGFEFDQIRAYSYGDDIRFMDWNSSARSGKLLVRQYLDERNRTIIICLDVSSSILFASQDNVVADIIQQTAAVIAFMGQFAQDHVGLLLFSDVVELFVPPSTGNKHIMRLVETIFSWKSENQKKTDFSCVTHYFMETYKQQAAVIIISDFIFDTYEKSLQQLVTQKEVIAIRCLDQVLQHLPSAGYLHAQDPETGQSILLDLSGQHTAIQKILHERIAEQNRIFQQCHVDYIDISASFDFIRMLVLQLKERMIVP